MAFGVYTGLFAVLDHRRKAVQKVCSQRRMPADGLYPLYPVLELGQDETEMGPLYPESYWHSYVAANTGPVQYPEIKQGYLRPVQR